MTTLLLGDINLDISLHVPAYPEAGKDAIVQQVHTRLGGSIVNTAVVLAGLGLPVRLIGRAGQDTPGDQALAALMASKIDISLVQRDLTMPTGQIFIVVSADGERTMFSARGANTRITPDSIPDDALKGISWLHLSTYSFLAAPQRDAAQKLLRMAVDDGISCSLDIADGHAGLLKSLLEDWLSKLTVLLLNQSDASVLLAPATPGDPQVVVETLLKQGPDVIALKLGAQGSVVGTREAIHRLPALPVTVVDTTGAGDAFAAGLIYGLQTGLSQKDAAWLASAKGALATTVSGAGTGLPGREALFVYLASLPPEASQDGWRERVVTHLGYNLFHRHEENSQHNEI